MAPQTKGTIACLSPDVYTELDGTNRRGRLKDGRDAKNVCLKTARGHFGEWKDCGGEFSVSELYVAINKTRNESEADKSRAQGLPGSGGEVARDVSAIFKFADEEAIPRVVVVLEKYSRTVIVELFVECTEMMRVKSRKNPITRL